MSNIERIPTKSSPRLFEAVIQEMQVQMGAGLAWLNHIFGKAEKHEHKGAYFLPSVYVGKGKYESIVPDRRDWGNYAFFYMEEPQEVSGGRRVPPYFDLEGAVNVIVFGDSRDIEAEDDRNLESIKNEVLNVLGGMRLTTGHVEWERVYERESVFEEYSMSEMDGQYLMWPFFSFRVKGKIVCNTGCVEN